MSNDHQGTQDKCGEEALLLGVLHESKKCSKGRPTNLWRDVKNRFVRPSGLAGGVAEITEFVAGVCLQARLSCPECAGRLRSLKLTFVYDGQVRRLFECLGCDGIFYIVVDDDTLPGRRWQHEEN